MGLKLVPVAGPSSITRLKRLNPLRIGTAEAAEGGFNLVPVAEKPKLNLVPVSEGAVARTPSGIGALERGIFTGWAGVPEAEVARVKALDFTPKERIIQNLMGPAGELVSALTPTKMGQKERAKIGLAISPVVEVFERFIRRPTAAWAVPTLESALGQRGIPTTPELLDNIISGYFAWGPPTKREMAGGYVAVRERPRYADLFKAEYAKIGMPPEQGRKWAALGEAALIVLSPEIMKGMKDISKATVRQATKGAKAAAKVVGRETEGFVRAMAEARQRGVAWNKLYQQSAKTLGKARAKEVLRILQEEESLLGQSVPPDYALRRIMPGVERPAIIKPAEFRPTPQDILKEIKAPKFIGEKPIVPKPEAPLPKPAVTAPITPAQLAAKVPKQVEEDIFELERDKTYFEEIGMTEKVTEIQKQIDVLKAPKAPVAPKFIGEKPVEALPAKVGLPGVKEIDISRENPMASKLSNEEIPLGNTQGAKIAHFKYYAGPFKQSLQKAVQTHPRVLELFARSGTLSRIIDMVVRDPKAEYVLGDIDKGIVAHQKFVKSNPIGVIHGYTEAKRLLIDKLSRETGLTAQALGDLQSFRRAFFALSPEKQRNFNTVANSVANEFFRGLSNQLQKQGIKTAKEAGHFLFINRNSARGTEKKQGIFNMAGFLKGAKLGEGAKFNLESAVRKMSKFLNKPGVEIEVADAFTQIEQAGPDAVLVSDSPYAEEAGYRAQAGQWTVKDSLRLIRMLADKNKTQGNPILYHDTWNEILVKEWQKLGYRPYPIKVMPSAGRGFGLKREMFVFAPGKEVAVPIKPKAIPKPAKVPVKKAAPPIKPPTQPPTALAGPPEEEHFQELADYFERAGEQDVAPRLSEEDIKLHEAEFKVMQGEAKSALFKAIKELGKIKPYAKGYLKEELTVIPNYLRTREAEAMTADEMAEALSAYGLNFTGDMDLITTIGDEIAMAAKAKIEYKEAKVYLKAWAKRIRAHTKATEKLIRSIGRILAKGTLRGPAVKKQVRLATGLTKLSTMVKEEKALAESLRKSERAAERAYQVGRKLGVEQEKARIVELRARQRTNKAISDEAKDLVERLKKLSLKGLPVNYQDRLDEIISSIDLEHLSARALAKRESMRIFAEQIKEEGDESNIPQEKLDALEKISPAEMTLDDLREVSEVVMRLYHQGKLANKLLTSQKERTFDEVKLEIVKTITGGVGLNEDAPVVRWVRENVKGYGNATLHFVKTYIAEHLRPEVMMEALDNYEAGISTKVIWDVLNKSQNKKYDEADRTLKKIIHIHKDVDIPRMMTERVSFGRFKNVTRDFAMFLYANSFNDSNMAHNYGSGVTDEDMAEVIKFLRPEEKAAVRNLIENYYDTDQYPAVDKVFSAIEGVHLKKEERYFPLLAIEDVSYNKELEKEILQRAYVRRPGVTRGFTEERVGSKKAFADFSYFTTVVRDWQKVEHYKAFAEAIRDVNKVLSNKEISSAITEKFGKEFKTVLDKWLKDVAYGGDRRAFGLLDKTARLLRVNFVTSVLGWNIMTAAKAPVSYMQGAEFVGKRATMRANMKFISGPFKLINEIAGKSTMMKHRSLRQEREFREIVAGRSVAGVLGRVRLRQKIREQAMLLYLITDKTTVNIIWWAGYDDYIRKGRTEAEAIAWADKAVRRTQPMGGVLHLPGMFRGPEYQRMYTMFKNQLNQNFNLVYEMYQKYGRKKMSFKKFISGHIMYLIASGLLIGVLSRKRLPKPKEVVFDSIHQFTGSLFILGGLTKDIMDYFVGRRGWDELGAVVPPPFQTWKDFRRFVTAKPGKRAKHAMRAAAKFTGIPYTQIERFVTGQPFGVIPGQKKKKGLRFTGGMPMPKAPKFTTPKFKSPKFTGGF